MLRVTAILTLGLMCAGTLLSCSPARTHGARPLSPDERQRAAERGQSFRAPLAPLSASSDYRLEHLTQARPPRLHADTDTALFVLTGRVRIALDGVGVELRAGESVEIPRDTWYMTESLGGESSVFFVFSSPGSSVPSATAPRRGTTHMLYSSRDGHH